MFSGETPFYDIPVEARIILSVLAGRRPAWPSDNSSRVRGLSDEMRELVETYWDQKPTNRPTATQIVQQLRVLASGRPDQRQQDDFSLNHLSHAMLSNQAEHPFATLGNSDSQIALVHQPSKKLTGLPCPPLPAIASREEDRPILQPTSLSPITNTRIKESSVGPLNADLSALVRIAFGVRKAAITGRLYRISPNIYAGIRDIHTPSGAQVAIFTEQYTYRQILALCRCVALRLISHSLWLRRAHKSHDGVQRLWSRSLQGRRYSATD